MNIQIVGEKNQNPKLLDDENHHVFGELRDPHSKPTTHLPGWHSGSGGPKNPSKV